MTEWRIDRARIKTELAHRNLTQRDLARMVDVSEASISYWLTGERVNPRLASRVAQCLGLPMEDIVKAVDLQSIA